MRVHGDRVGESIDDACRHVAWEKSRGRQAWQVWHALTGTRRNATWDEVIILIARWLRGHD